MRRCTPSEARQARGAANTGLNTVTFGRGVIVTALAVSLHWDGMVDGSCRYADQSGAGRPPPARHVSPKYAAAFQAAPCRCSGLRVRVKVAGLSAANAASDGKVNVPS